MALPRIPERLRRALIALPGAAEAGDGPRLNLLAWFALSGALAIAVFCATMAWLLTEFVSSRLLLRDAAISRDFVQSIVAIQHVEPAFEARDPMAVEGFDEFFAHLAAMPDVLRANIYSPGGRLLWSSRKELIGREFGTNPELEQALTGAAVVKLAADHDPGKDEHALLPGTRREFVENYLPVRDAAGQRVLAVVELYRRPVALFDAIRSGRVLVWSSAALGGLFLFASLLWFVRRAERALREQQARRVDAEAMAMVGEIAAAVAHSIRNPLGSIRSSAELLGETLPEARRSTDDTVRQVDRIEHLVRTLLTYVRDPAIERQAAAELGPVLRDAHRRFLPEVQAQGKSLTLQVEAGIGRVAGDPILLAQALNSLLANALEATSRGGRIVLAATLEGRQVAVQVEDDGVGIPPERLQEVLAPLGSTKPGGLGIGLALVRRFAQRSGGGLELARLSRGTRATLRLPLQTG